MFHPHVQRVIVLAAGLAFLAYAISTDEKEAPSGSKNDDSDDKSGSAPDDTSDKSAPSDSVDDINLVDAAAAAGQFGTWSLAVKQSGLTDKLEGQGPFTLFVPTDDAFGTIGAKLDELLADKKALRRTLECHIVDGLFTAADLAGGASLITLAGTELMITATDGIAIGESKVVDADLTAVNGVIHGIDAILPASGDTA